MEAIKDCPLCHSNSILIKTDNHVSLRCFCCSLGLNAPKHQVEYAIKQWNELPRKNKNDEVVDDNLKIPRRFTYLLDSNQNKIFEHDILKFTWEFPSGEKTEKIAYVAFGNPNNNYTWGFELMFLGDIDVDTDILLWVGTHDVECKIIGNIFNNPEILNG